MNINYIATYKAGGVTMPIYRGEIKRACNVPPASSPTDAIDLAKWDAKMEAGRNLCLPASMIEIENIRLT